MDLFLDDPNIDIDTPERNYIANAYGVCLLSSLIPGLSLVIAFVLNKREKYKSSFSKQHLNNLLKLQLIVFISSLIAIVILMFLGNFYLWLFILFILLFQATYTYKGIVSAKAGTINSFPFSF